VALEFGKMQPMAAHLSKQERGLIAIYLAGSAPADDWIAEHSCNTPAADDRNEYVTNWGFGNANRRFVPPHGTGAALYIRPLLIGTGAEVGVKPASEYMLLIFVTPVGPYFKTGFKPVDLIVEEQVDRTAPLGVGDVKVGGNYAASLRAGMAAKKKGFADCIYLDAKHKRYIDESGPANFFAITQDDRYVTPESHTILPSITNMSLIELAREMGLNPERRPVEIDEIFSFKEVGCCGTAAVITPVGSITWRDRKQVYCPDGVAGPRCTALYERLREIQTGDLPDEHGWLRRIPPR